MGDYNRKRRLRFAAENIPNSALLDAVGDLLRLEREVTTRQAFNVAEVRRRRDDAPATFVESWGTAVGTIGPPATAAALANGWTGNGTVSGGRFYNSAGITRPVPTSQRWTMRSVFKAPGTTGKSNYMGIVCVDGSVLGLGQGSAAATAFINRTGSVPAAAVGLPRALPALPAGDYLVTMTKDETSLSLMIQTAGNSGQNVFGTRILLSALASPIASVFISATDTVQAGQTWGPVVLHQELAVPTGSNRSTLYGNTQPLVHWHQEANGNTWYIQAPGDYDPRVPAPLVVFCHQSLASSGAGGTAPWAEARWANVLSALNAAGYIVATSDNGPALTSGGTQDRYGTQAGLDDYAALIKWVRQRFATGPLFLLGASMGGFFTMEMLHRREVGGIAAVANISSGFDLAAGLALETYRPLLLAAWGAADDQDFLNKTASHDPARQQGWEFRGAPVRLYGGTADVLAPPADAIDPLIGLLSPFSDDVSKVIVNGADHLNAALYQGNDLVTFFNKYR